MKRNATRLVCWALCMVYATILCAQEQPGNYRWTKVTEHAGWQPRDSSGELVFDNRMWILGGWFQSFAAPPRDVWSSRDGRQWRMITLEAPWRYSDLPMTIAFKNRMWIMGGWTNGRLEGHGATNEVWSSPNGAEWELKSEAAWSPRLAAGIVEFKGRMWILGGTENYYFGNQSSLKNDVWSSADGMRWQLETPHAQWSPRAYHQAVVLGDRIYVMGGGNYVPEYHALNDVWSSADGKTWRCETPAAQWSPRLWFSALSYRNHLWVLGGWSNNPSTNWDDSWYSADGRSWQKLQVSSGWKARHEHSAYVFQDKLWVAGGHAQPLGSDVWYLELPKDFGVAK